MNASPLKTVFLDFDTVSNGDLDLGRLRQAADDLTLYESDESKIAQRIEDADIVLLNKLDLTRALLSGAPRLKLIAVAGTGTNNIDLSAARDLGIAVCNVTRLLHRLGGAAGLGADLEPHATRGRLFAPHPGRVLGKGRGGRCWPIPSANYRAGYSA